MNVAICIGTFNSRSDLVNEVLSKSIETYRKWGIDVYYMDSSEDDSVKNVVEKYIAEGYSNLRYEKKEDKDKAVSYYTGKIFDKEYDYVWAVKDRVFFDEKTIERVYGAMEEGHDAIILGFLPQYTRRPCETKVYDKPEELYLDWGFMTTSLDATVFNRRTMLSGVTEEQIRSTTVSFTHFEVLFHMLVKEQRSVKALVGNDIVARNIKGVGSSYKAEMFEIWQDEWIEANEKLPAYYEKYKAQVIKQTTSLPWLFGSVGALLEYRRLNALNAKNVDKIAKNWNKVSNIPVDTLIKIANDTYDITHDLSIIPSSINELVNLLIEMANRLRKGQMQKEQIPYESILKGIMNYVIKKYNGNGYIANCINGTVHDVLYYLHDTATSQEEIQKSIQTLISILILSL